MTPNEPQYRDALLRFFSAAGDWRKMTDGQLASWIGLTLAEEFGGATFGEDGELVTSKQELALTDEDVYRLNETVWHDRPAESIAEAKRRLAQPWWRIHERPTNA